MTIRFKSIHAVRSPRHGVAAVELGLLLPLLVTVVLAAVDFGRFAYAHIVLTNATRAGADFASLNPYTSGTQLNWEAQLRSKVALEMESVMNTDDFGPSDLKINLTRTLDPDTLWRVRVEASYPFKMIVPWPGLQNRLELRRVVEMRGIR